MKALIFESFTITEIPRQRRIRKVDAMPLTGWPSVDPYPTAQLEDVVSISVYGAYKTLIGEVVGKVRRRQRFASPMGDGTVFVIGDIERIGNRSKIKAISILKTRK